MNKEIEEAIKSMQERVDDLQRYILNYEKSDCKTGLYQSLVKEKEDVETVLNYIKDSTPNSVIREKIGIVIDKLEKSNFGGWADELRDILEEILEEGEKKDG